MDKPVKFTTHPSEDALEEYAFDRLSESSTAALEEHLLICESCQLALARVDEYIQLMKTAAAQIPPPSQPRWSPASFRKFLSKRPMLAVWVASFALLCLSLAATRRSASLSPPVTVKLDALRGNDADLPHAPAHRQLDLAMEATDVISLGRFHAELVSGNGDIVWTGSASVAGDRVIAQVSKDLKPGVYWARLYSSAKPPTDGLIREFGLHVD